MTARARRPGRSRRALPRKRSASGHERTNRRYWERVADEHQARHARALLESGAAWGVWRIPEADLGVLGDVRGKDVLEVGCGAAQWSIALARAGARCVGLDISRRQLGHAGVLAERSGVAVRLIAGSAETLPFADASFDVVLSDHGGFTFADPQRTVPEAARVLRPGGLLAFCNASPLNFVCWDDERGRLGRTLRLDYFGMRSATDGRMVEFQLPYGEWIRLFRRSGLVLEDLLELRPPSGARTTFEGYPASWARRWPAENVWLARRARG